MAIFGQVPVQHAAELAAIVAKLLTGGAPALVDAESPGIGIVADMAGMDDDEVFAMMGMRPVPVGGDLAADLAVVERKGPEMLGDEDDRIALAFVGAKCPRGHHAIALESERQAIIVQPRHELAVTHRVVAKAKILDDTLHQVKPLPLSDVHIGRANRSAKQYHEPAARASHTLHAAVKWRLFYSAASASSSVCLL